MSSTAQVHEPARPSSKRLESMDAIRVCAMLAVVMLHVSSIILLEEFSSLPPSWWWIGNFVYAFTLPCIPLFIMLSGALLLNPAKDESISLFLRKRANRIVLPFLFWSIAHLIWRWGFHHESLTWSQAIREIFQGPAYFHLWFLYLIIGLYLATPIFRTYLKQASLKDVVYFVTVWFVFTSLNPFIGRLVGVQLEIHFPFAQKGLAGLGIYFILGYLLSRVSLQKWHVFLAVGSIIVGTLVTALGTYFLTVRDAGVYNEYFAGWHLPHLVIMSAAMFVLLKDLPYAAIYTRFPAVLAVVKLVSATSFGIYLSHMMVIEALGRGWRGISLDALTLHPLLGIPLTFGLATGICVLVVTLLQKTPYLRRIIL